MNNCEKNIDVIAIAMTDASCLFIEENILKVARCDMNCSKCLETVKKWLLEDDCKPTEQEIVLKAINDYEKLSIEEVREQVKPIIKSHNKTYLSNYTGVCEATLRYFCDERKKTAKLRFDVYVKLMALGVKEKKSRRQRKKVTEEEWAERKQRSKEKRREYQRLYHQKYREKKKKAQQDSALMEEK